MNYTNNYHLPQWERSDRLLMDDFNSAMANIESGFGRLESSSEERSFLRLCRMAYNHYGLLRGMDALPRQDGVFIQNLLRSSEGVSGFVEFDGAYRLNFAGGADQAALFKALRQSSLLKTSPTSALVVRFTAPCNGTMDKLGIQISSTNSSGATNFYCHIVCTDRSTGQTVIEKSTSFPVPNGTMTYTYGLYVGLNFHQGREYEIRVSQEKSVSATLSASINTEEFKAASVVTESEGSAVHAFTEPGENMGFLVPVLFRGAVPPKLLWNGGETAVLWSREWEDGQEIVFAQRGAVQNGDSFRLVFTCPQNQEICFYEWGALLI